MPAVSRSFPPPALESTIDDPNADLGELLGDADPLRADAEPPEAAPLDDLEDDHTAMFTAADAARFSRPAPPDLGEDLEIDIEEVDIEEDEIVQQVAARPPGGRTQPPPPPRTPSEAPKSARPSEAPARGFLGKLLQRKP